MKIHEKNRKFSRVLCTADIYSIGGKTIIFSSVEVYLKCIFSSSFLILFFKMLFVLEKPGKVNRINLNVMI